MVNSHPRDGDPRSTSATPSTWSPPSQTYASMAAANTAPKNTHKNPAIFATTYSHPEYGHLAVPPKRSPHLDNAVSPWSIAYLVPKTVTPAEIHDAAFDTFEQNSDNPVLGVDRFPSSSNSHHRVEVSYNSSIDPALTATIPINVRGVDYLPVSTQTDFIITRFTIGDYRFNPADVHFEDLSRFARHFAAEYQLRMAQLSPK